MGKSLRILVFAASVVAVLATVGAVAAAVVGSSQKEAGEPVDATVAAMSINVSALGRLEPATRVRKIAPKSSKPGVTVHELCVSLGADVQEGRLLAVLDDHDLQLAAVALAEAEVANAKARLDRVLAGPKEEDVAAKEVDIELLVTTRDHLKRLWERSRQLVKSRAVTSESLEDRRWQYDRAALEYQRTVEELRSLKRVRSIDIDVAEADLSVAEATLQRARADLVLTEIRSPIAGKVLAINTWPGERVADDGLLELGDVSRMQAVAEVYEGDLPRVAVGQPATVRIPSSELLVVGTVAELGQRVARKDVLSNDPVSDTDARVIEVRIDLDLDELEPLDRDVVTRLSNARVEVIIETAPKEVETSPSPGES